VTRRRFKPLDDGLDELLVLIEEREKLRQLPRPRGRKVGSRIASLTRRIKNESRYEAYRDRCWRRTHGEGNE